MADTGRKRLLDKEPHLQLPFQWVRPKLWDLAGLIAASLGATLTSINLVLVGRFGGPSWGTVTVLFVLAQLAVCFLSLMVLGKTAKEGTIWGNLLALAGGCLGIGGVLLAAALWILT